MAIKQETNTNTTNSFDKILQRLNMEAPNTFRIPISLDRCPAIKVARPNKPRQEIKTAKKAKKPASLPICSSAENLRPYASSVNWYSNGLPGSYFTKTCSILTNASLTGTDGLILTVITCIRLLSDIIKKVGCTGIYGDSITMS